MLSSYCGGHRPPLRINPLLFHPANLAQPVCASARDVQDEAHAPAAVAAAMLALIPTELPVKARFGADR
jgi:hypothetical protein